LTEPRDQSIEIRSIDPLIIFRIIRVRGEMTPYFVYSDICSNEPDAKFKSGIDAIEYILLLNKAFKKRHDLKNGLD